MLTVFEKDGYEALATRTNLDLQTLGWEYPTVILTLDAKRRLSIPVALAPSSPGDAFEALYDEEDDEIVLRRVKRAKSNWLKVWKQCPVPMDDLPPREPRDGKKTQAVSWLLDADILSQPVKSRGNPAVIDWLEREQGNAFRRQHRDRTDGILDSHEGRHSA